MHLRLRFFRSQKYRLIWPMNRQNATDNAVTNPVTPMPRRSWAAPGAVFVRGCAVILTIKRWGVLSEATQLYNEAVVKIQQRPWHQTGRRSIHDGFGPNLELLSVFRTIHAQVRSLRYGFVGACHMRSSSCYRTTHFTWPRIIAEATFTQAHKSLQVFNRTLECIL